MRAFPDGVSRRHLMACRASGKGALRRSVARCEQAEARWQLRAPRAAQDRIDDLDRRHQFPVRIRFGEAADRQALRIDRAAAGHEQHGQPLRRGMARHIDAILVALQRDVGDDQIHAALIDHADGMIMIVHRRGDAIAGLLQRMFIVEGDQRLILHHQNGADGLAGRSARVFLFHQTEKHLPSPP